MDHGMREIAASMLRNLFLAWWKTSTSIRRVADRASQRRKSPCPVPGLADCRFVAVAGFARSGLSSFLATTKSMSCFTLNISVTRLLP